MSSIIQYRLETNSLTVCTPRSPCPRFGTATLQSSFSSSLVSSSASGQYLLSGPLAAAARSPASATTPMRVPPAWDFSLFGDSCSPNGACEPALDAAGESGCEYRFETADGQTDLDRRSRLGARQSKVPPYRPRRWWNLGVRISLHCYRTHLPHQPYLRLRRLRW
jgi:hypothetical protein